MDNKTFLQRVNIHGLFEFNQLAADPVAIQVVTAKVTSPPLSLSVTMLLSTPPLLPLSPPAHPAEASLQSLSFTRGSQWKMP